VDCLLDKDDVIYYLSFFNETSLRGRDEVGKKTFDLVCNNFGNDFIRNIAKRNGLEFVGGWIYLFRNESQER